jgi:DNA modification methylase
MEIVRKSISDLIPDPNNARKHDQKNLDAIKGSLAKFGQQKPIVIDKNNIVIAGNGTLQSARALGWTDIDCVVTTLEGFNAAAFGLADNRTSELAEWDTDVLSESLKGLIEAEFDIGEIGFDEDFLKVEPVEGLTDPDEVPENVETRCKPGDLWVLGNHRLLCGDSTNVQHVERLMNGEKADMVFTDPPYGMNLQTDYKESLGDNGFRKAKTYSAVIGDDAPFNFADSFALVQDVKEQFWWGADWYCQQLPSDGAWFVWNKRTSEGLQKMYGNHFELCWSRQRHKREIAEVAWAGAFGHNKKDDGATKVHPTMKSVKLIEWFFERFKGERVLDLFLGSGSTLIACEKTGRKCYGMEIDPKYCDVIISRWEKFTGKKAVLDGST